MNGKSFGISTSYNLMVDSLATSNATGEIYIGGTQYLNDLKNGAA